MIELLESIHPDVPRMFGMVFLLMVVALVSLTVLAFVFNAVQRGSWLVAGLAVLTIGGFGAYLLNSQRVVAEAREVQLAFEQAKVEAAAALDVVADMERSGVARPQIDLEAASPSDSSEDKDEIGETPDERDALDASAEAPDWLVASREGDRVATERDGKLYKVFSSGPALTLEACREEAQEQLKEWALQWAAEEGADARLVVERMLDPAHWSDYRDACQLELTEHAEPRETSVGRFLTLYTLAEVDLSTVREFIAEKSVEVRKQRGVKQVATTGGLVLAGVATLNLWLRCGRRGGCDKVV